MDAEVSIQKALSLFSSRDPEESTLGREILFRRYVNRREVWDAFVAYVVDRPAPDIPPTLIYYLAHAPWHPDIAWAGDEPISNETRDYAMKLLRKRFGRREVIKLLECIDENGVSRGSIGQSITAIITTLYELGPILAGISRDRSLPLATREFATLIIAMREGRDAIPILTELARSGSETFAWEVISRLRQHGHV